MIKFSKIFVLTLVLLAVLSKPAFAGESWIDKVKNPEYKGTINLPHYSVNMNNLTKELLKIKKQEKKEKKITYSKPNAEVNAAVKSTLNTLATKSFNRKITFFAKQMLGKGEFGKYVPKSIKNNYLKLLKNSKPFDMAGGHRLFLVISSSIPFKTLRRYVFQIVNNNLPVQMILRGLLPGSDNGRYFMPTIKYIERLIKYKGRSGYYDIHVDIDPLIPSKYNIKVVPALVYDVNYNPQTYTTIDDKAYVVYGNVDLEYALKQIENKTHSEYIKEVLNRFNKNSFFNK
jgi:type-F conjugative transfer system pilin assembly protein TrbC